MSEKRQEDQGKKKTLEDIQEENRQIIEVMEEASRNYTKYSIISMLIAVIVFITLVKLTEPIREKRESVVVGEESEFVDEGMGKELEEEIKEIPIWVGKTIEELKTVDGRPRIVYFSTTDCKYCVEQEKEFAKLGLEEKGVEVVHLDKEKHREIVAEMGIEGYPTLFYITKEGEFLDKVGGKEYTYGDGVAEGNLGLKRKGELEDRVKRLIE